MTGGPGLSAGEREREGKGKEVAGWATAQEGEKRARGELGRNRPKEEGGGQKKGFSFFIFPKQFSNSFLK